MPEAKPPMKHPRRHPVGIVAGWTIAASILLSAGVPGAAGAEGSITERPLVAPMPRGKTLFTQLSPDDTGVKTVNNYADPRMWGDLYLEAGVGSIGCGVAIGDYDGDGRPDIFVVSKTEGCRLFRNLGGYKFEDVTEKAGVGGTPGVWNQGATFVDINNSGRLDIYVCRFNAPNLLYINQGDGTFKEMAHAYGLDVVDASVMASFCDYTREGRLGMYLVTNLLDIGKHPSGQRGYLFHNNGDGTFTNVTEKAGIFGEAQSHSGTWWDFENSGWPGLYVADDFGIPDKLYRNNRDGTFTDVISQVLPHTTFASMGSDLGDVRNDGHIDFFVADMAATTHQKDQRTASNIRAGETKLREDTPIAPKYLHNALYINTGTGRFMEGAFLAGIAATDWTWSVRLEDLDNDGRLDLFVTNGMNREQSNVDLIAREMRAESAADRARIMHDSPIMAERHLAFRNVGDLEFRDVSAEWGLDQKGVSFGAAFGDLNGDGNLDLVYTNYLGGVSIFRNDSDSGHRVDVDLRGTASNRYGIGATVKVESDLGIQVRPLWLARGYMSSSEPMVHFGLGKDTIIRRMTVTWPSGNVQVFENLGVDRRFTVTEPSGTPSPVPAPAALPKLFDEVSGSSGLSLRSAEEDVDETTEQRLLPVRLNRRGPALAVGDIFGNGRDDVVVAGTTLSPLRILRSESPGSYVKTDASSFATPNGADDGPVLLFDATGKGTTDLLVTKGGDALQADAPEFQPRLYLNDGHGAFRPAPDGALPPFPVSVGAVAAADFDRSGRLGLFIGGRVVPGQYPQSPRSALFANRGGTFEDVTDTLSPGLRQIGMVTSALWTDVDGDGWPDLLITVEWGNVLYFHNNQGKGFEDWTQRAGFAAAGTGWWTSIAAADFNGDGRTDYVVGNVGLNTQYRADAAHPALLYSGDFKGNGSSQLIQAYYEGDKLYPWRSRSDLGAAIPSILKKFPLNDAFARATLPEIFGPEKLAKAVRFAATELRSGVFLSQPDGTFVFEPLPRVAQIAPLQGMVAGDFLGDGHPGFYAVQNSFAPIPLVGRFDGGISQMMRGDGRGHFTPVAPAESNLVVPGDAKALAVLQLGDDGRPGFLVTRNADTTLAFRQTGADSAGHLRIVLKGLPGNPTAVGSFVTVTFADGSTETSEVYAGSGLYSQSSPACYFGFARSNPPKTIRVRWPSGLSSETPAQPMSTIQTVSAPRPGSQP